MSKFRKIPLTSNELMIWKRNKHINPRTNRKIKVNSRLYKYIKNEYYKNFPLGVDVLDSNDERDPISLEVFYRIDASNNKILVYKEISNLIVYKESESITRCFEKDSLQYMKTYNITSHPVSQRGIPISIFENLEAIEIDSNISVEDKALQVFQIFTKISIFIDYKLFLKLDKDDLKKLNYELKDFYYQNFSDSDRSKIDNSDGKQFFKLDKSDFNDKDEDNIKMYLLNEIENILSYKEEDLKFMINYIVLGGLSLVIDEVKEYYDNFNFSF